MFSLPYFFSFIKINIEVVRTRVRVYGYEIIPVTRWGWDETKIWYPLDLGMEMGINFFCKNGYGIAKPVSAPPVAIPRHTCLHSLDLLAIMCFSAHFPPKKRKKGWKKKESKAQSGKESKKIKSCSNIIMNLSEKYKQIFWCELK